MKSILLALLLLTGFVRLAISQPMSEKAEIWQTASDSAGNLFVLGGFDDTLKIGNTILISSDREHCSHFLAGYKKSGNLEWAINLGTTYYFPYNHLTVSKTGEVYLAKNQRYGPIMLVKYSNAGEMCWTKTFGYSVYDGCYSLQLDDFGNLMMTGCFSYLGSYGHITINGEMKQRFIAQLNPEGECLWVVKVPGLK